MIDKNKRLRKMSSIAISLRRLPQNGTLTVLQQAMTYAQMLDVPFVYSSNGDAFCEHDFLTG